MDSNIIVLHVRGFTDDPAEAEEKSKVRIPRVRKIYAKHGIDFREVEAWPNGLSTTSIDDAVDNVRIAADKVYEENPRALIGLSGHSLGANVALIAAYSMKVDFLVVLDGVFGGAYDFVLQYKWDPKNPSVVTGLRKNSTGVKTIHTILSDKTNEWPPILEVRSWFAIIGQIVFRSFPVTGHGKIIRRPLLNHTQIWQDGKTIELIAKFIHSVNDYQHDWR